ncbi:MAG: universal stress protein [Desulfobacca sp.]|nr:universal stress protein [Desulfobacca sp.]
MKNISYPLTRILIPFDGSPAARLAMELSSSLVRAGGEAVQNLTLLRVIGGGYLSRHIQNVDLRVTHMDQLKEWQRIRNRYLDEEIYPLLAEAEQILRDLGVTTSIARRVAEGKIGKEIIRLAMDEGFSAIIMGRRGLSTVKELLLGSATQKVLAQAQGMTVYVVGQKLGLDPNCPISPILVPIDGSEPSMEALRQAATLVQAFQSFKPRLTLLHVVDLAVLGPRISEGITPSQLTELLEKHEQEFLKEGREVLREAGLNGLWEEKLLTGNPPQAIAQEAEAGQYALIMMGKKGRSALEKLFMGSVASGVLHRVSHPTVALVCR